MVRSAPSLSVRRLRTLEGGEPKVGMFSAGITPRGPSHAGAAQFDTVAAALHNQFMGRRLLALALCATFLGVLTSARVQCAGWDSSPVNRHSCCAESGHEATTQEATDCCLGVEQASQPNAAAQTFHLPPLGAVPRVFVPVAPARPAPGASSFLDRVQLEPPPPLFLKNRSFLI